MKTWQEALKILLEEINLPVADLADMTGSHKSSIHKYIQGKLNSTAGTVESWLDACERYRLGSKKIFYSICLEEDISTRGKTKRFIQEHVDNMTAQELASYVRAIGNRLARGTDIEDSIDVPSNVSETKALPPSKTELLQETKLVRAKEAQ